MDTMIRETIPTMPAGPTPFRLIKRNGSVTAFDDRKINEAVKKAYVAVEGSTAAATTSARAQIERITSTAVQAVKRNRVEGGLIHIEDVQDQVELALMRADDEVLNRIGRSYIEYRNERAKQRAWDEAEQRANEEALGQGPAETIHYLDEDGEAVTFDRAAMLRKITSACQGLSDVSAQPIMQETMRKVYDRMSVADMDQAPILAARALVETDPNYAFVAARLLLDVLRNEALTTASGTRTTATQADMAELYPSYFRNYIRKGIAVERIDPELAHFDLGRLGAALRPERDLTFAFQGMQILYDRYFLHEDEKRYEMPQAFFMRVAMGLAMREIDREGWAIKFYEVLSNHEYMASTPTLFNAGTIRPQLSSCFLTTIADDLDSIYSAIKDNAMLAKYSGGIGNDWTPVRGLGAHIKGTNGKSQGTVPFMTVADATAVAVNQGGKRQGAVCGYLEAWHIDFPEFIDLRNKGADPRRGTPDMDIAAWYPDLFMERLEADADWTLFSPNEVPDLHDLYGNAFRPAYEAYERKALAGGIKLWKTVKAKDLFRANLRALFETGHPWVTFKDPCNLRSPQQHVGVVHSSNLCTEITLNTSAEEVAVCNLGSVNLVRHLTDGKLDLEKLRRTIAVAMRMLDNVIDVNMYTITQARTSNLRHRPVALGMMGFHECIQRQGIAYGSQEAVEFADRSMEAISYYAIEGSAELARERGPYPSFKGSLWSQGILPIDSISMLRDARASLDMDESSTMDWDALREKVRQGMRNSNTMAIAPTATISNICNVSQSIEPNLDNLFVKDNLSGKFTTLNAVMVRELKRLDLWGPAMVSDLKYFDGSLAKIDGVPDEVKRVFQTAYEIPTEWMIECASRRQKWIDQAQSFNVYLPNASGKLLEQAYKLAWRKGLKTTYYMRATAASSVEKSTSTRTDGKLNTVAVARGVAEDPATVSAPTPAVSTQKTEEADAPDNWGQACSIDAGPDCEACQ